jgi:CheY-like chemotaxis protein
MTLPEGSRKMRVLLVFNERVIADTLKIILNQTGYEPFAVYSGEEAVECARMVKPDVILCDIAMWNGMNGIEAAFVIRGFLSTCKMMLTAGSTGAFKMLDKARDDGVEFEEISMPVHPQILLPRLAELQNEL